MSSSDDWGSLGATWREGGPAAPPGSPAPNPREALASTLARAVRRKRLSMFVLVGIEVCFTLAALVILWRGLLDPRHAVFSEARQWWTWATVALILGVQAVVLYVRRGQWRIPTLAVADLLEVTAKRARTGVRLVWLNLIGFVVFVLMTIPPLLAEWPTHPRQARLLLLGKVAAGLITAAAVIGVLYLRRQRRILRRVAELRHSLEG